VVVIVPESGDAVQAMKAGLMEIANIFAVNKSDRPGSQRLISDLKLTLQLKHRTGDEWREPVVGTVATTTDGVDKLHQVVGDYIEYSKKSGRFDRRRRAQIGKKIIAIMMHRFKQDKLKRIANQVDLDKVVYRIQQGETDPYTVGDELYHRYR
jgi:LAO/AO transport system kinase